MSHYYPYGNIFDEAKSNISDEKKEIDRVRLMKNIGDLATGWGRTEAENDKLKIEVEYLKKRDKAEIGYLEGRLNLRGALLAISFILNVAMIGVVTVLYVAQTMAIK